MSMQDRNGWIRYRSRRRRGQAEFRGEYRAVGAATQSRPGSIEHFLTERYCLYSVLGKTVLRADIHHHPWPLQQAEARIEANTVAAASGMALPDQAPLLHFAKRIDMVVFAPGSAVPAGLTP
jgi:uncharacterized protein